ncbi:MAG: tetratricopeptide repeat protein [Bryobacteraceae bacterium]
MKIPQSYAITLLAILSGGTGWPADPCAEGTEALRRRDLTAAESALRQCTQQASAPVEAHLMLCGVYQLQGDAVGLYRAARAGLKRYPAEKRFYLTAGTHAGREKRFLEATEILEPAHRRWPDDEKVAALLESAHLGEGMAQLDGGDNEAALRHLSRAAELAPGDVEAILNLGRALHNVHRGEEALEAFDRAVSIDPKTPLANFHRGMTRYGLGRLQEAIGDIDAELAANAGYAPALLVRGLARMALGEWQAAEPDLDAAAKAMPADAPAQFALARCLLRLGKREQAEARLRRTIELTPADPSPKNMLVRVLFESGRAAEAKALAAEAAELARRERSAAPGQIKFQSYRRPAP